MSHTSRSWERVLDALGWNPDDFVVPCHEIEVPTDLDTIYSWASAPVGNVVEVLLRAHPSVPGGAFLPLFSGDALRKTARALWEVRSEPTRVAALMVQAHYHSEAGGLQRSELGYLDFVALAAKVGPVPDWHHRARSLLPIGIEVPCPRKGEPAISYTEILPVLAKNLQENLARYPLVRISTKPGAA